MNILKNNSQNETEHQLIFFRVVLTIANLLSWQFFPILIYRETESIAQVVLVQLLFLTGVWVGFVIMTFLNDRLGSLRSFKLSYLVEGLVLIGTALVVDHVVEYLILISLARGIARGLFWPVHHSAMQRNIHGVKRSGLLNIVASLNLVMIVFIPVLNGALISYIDTYFFSLALGGVVLLFGAMYPFKINKKTNSKLRSSEINRILENPKFHKYSIIIFFYEGLRNLVAFSMFIIPFLIIQSEFGVGLLLSLVGIGSAVFLFLKRNEDFTQRFRLASTFQIFDIVINTLLAVIWAPIMLIIKSLSDSLIKNYSYSVLDDMHYRIREKILGDFLNESTPEMNIIAETLYFISRFSVYAIFYVILIQFDLNQLEDVFRIVFVIATIGNVIAFLVLGKLHETMKIGKKFSY